MKTVYNCNRGLSVVELLISLAMIGILSTIAISNYKDLFGSSERVLCRDFTEQINGALKEFQQSAWGITLAVDDASADDEIRIVQSLQHKDVTIFGSPFLRLDWIPAEGDDVETYRLRWNGATLELIEPGTTGHGIWFDPQGSQFGTRVTLPPGFQPTT